MNDEMYDEGLQIRREVVGDEYVDRALASADEFTLEFQRYVTTYCWGLAWSREDLDRRTRSMVTVAALAGAGRWSELATHTRGALNNGVTPDELKGVYLHLATYLGVPAALEAFRQAQPVVAAWRSAQPAPS